VRDSVSQGFRSAAYKELTAPSSCADVSKNALEDVSKNALDVSKNALEEWHKLA
jgi:hypothetical protein